MDIADLAWRMADKVGPLLPPDGQKLIFIELGADEPWRAIATLLVAAQRASVEIPGHLVTQLRDWLNRYHGSIEEPQLRGLLDHMRDHPELFENV